MIALTAQVLDEEVERVKASGFNMVLGKPFMEEDLEAAIRSVLRRKPGRPQASVAVAAGLHSAAAPELVHEKDA
jgi:DNA-binding response OmpR family regulator